MAARKNSVPIVLLATCLLLSGCKDGFDEKSFQTITLTFAPVKTKLPSSYVFISPNAFIDTVRFSDLPDPSVKKYLDELYMLQSETNEVDIYITRDIDFPAVIFFSRRDFTPINKYTLRLSTERIETILANTTRKTEIRTNRMEARIFERSESMIAKLKYRISGPDFTYYKTQYYISSGRTDETYVVTFENTEEEDLESLIFSMIIDPPID